MQGSGRPTRSNVVGRGGDARVVTHRAKLSPPSTMCKQRTPNLSTRRHDERRDAEDRLPARRGQTQHGESARRRRSRGRTLVVGAGATSVQGQPGRSGPAIVYSPPRGVGRHPLAVRGEDPRRRSVSARAIGHVTRRRCRPATPAVGVLADENSPGRGHHRTIGTRRGASGIRPHAEKPGRPRSRRVPPAARREGPRQTRTSERRCRRPAGRRRPGEGWVVRTVVDKVDLASTRCALGTSGD